MSTFSQGVVFVLAVLKRHTQAHGGGGLFPAWPTFLQLQVNDVCDGHCVMCAIWQHQPEENEVSLDVLGNTLSASFFRAVEQIEITGGEPTLRADLPTIAACIASSLPRATKLQIVTNARKPEQVTERLLAVAQEIRHTRVRLEVAVSLDGIGETHDRIRGIPGSFSAAVQVIETLQQADVPVSILCTLTPLNCYDADDVRLWSQQHGIADCRFRPAIAVKRYDNADFVERYRFTPEQRFHLANFFESQARQAGLMLREKLYFKSLVDQIALERSRQATCRWQTQAVALDMSGNLRFCPVQSPVLGTVHREDPRHIYSQGASVRSHIIQKHCPTCQYDAVDLPPLNVLIGRGHAVLGQKIKRLFLSRPSPVEVGKVWPATHDAPRQWRKVLITGWYGTETTGDKAILAEVLHFLERHAPGCQVVLTTIDRKVSQQTERELNGLIGSTLVDLPHAADPALIESVDAVMVGGGPLMDTSAMEWVYRIFRQANRQRKARIIFGCGVGPLRSERMRQLTAAVLHMATAGFLRDAESHAAAAQLAPGNPLVYACDPAVGYLCRWRESHPAARPGRDIPRQIAVMLRANTGEFLTADGTQQISTANVQAARQMAQFLELACTTAQARASLLPMNCHWLGGDDRLFNRQVAGNFGDPTAVQVEKAYLPLDDVSGQVAAADVGVAMRYHGHLFCMALGIPFLSIDYTGYPGKVNSLVHRIGYQQWSEEWHTLDAKRAARRLQQLFAERTQWANFLIQQANELSASLQQTYQTLFSIQE